MKWGQPRSLQARQLMAASLGLVAFLALAGYALDRAFLQTAESSLRTRLENYALAYADKSDFARNGEFIPPFESIEPRFEPYFLALCNVAIGNKERAVELLDAARVERSGWILWLGTEPKLNSLRNFPPFIELFEKTGLPA